jgi:acetyl-CoA synthetase
VTLKAGEEKSEQLVATLKEHVRKMIGPIATPDRIQFADELPKTRSGKIVRRILTKIATGDITNFGDTSTLTDTSVLADLISRRLEGSLGCA